MKFTSEDLLKAMGLKVGQTVCVDNTMNFLIYKRGDSDICFENLRSHSVISADKFVEYILDFDYCIIQPTPTLTEDEKVILRNVPKMYKSVYIDEFNWLVLKFEMISYHLDLYKHLFHALQTGVEYSIEELLGEKV